MEITKVWQEALNSLRSQVTAVSFDLWINTLEPIDFVEGTFILSTTSESAKNRVLELHSTQIRLALKEASETGYWLELLYRTKYIDEQAFKSLSSKCTSLRAMLIASCRTAKENAK